MTGEFRPSLGPRRHSSASASQSLSRYSRPWGLCLLLLGMGTGCFIRRAIQCPVLQLPLMYDPLGHPNPDDIPVGVLAAALPCMVRPIPSSASLLPSAVEVGPCQFLGMGSPGHTLSLQCAPSSRPPCLPHIGVHQRSRAQRARPLSRREPVGNQGHSAAMEPEAGSSGSGLVHLRSFRADLPVCRSRA